MPIFAKLLDPHFLKLAAYGVAGMALIGYTVYFDHKRVTDPGYKNRIRQKRREEAERAKREYDKFNAFPHPSDKMAQQQYFMRQLSRGEELRSMGRIEEAVVHFTNAVVVSDQPYEILNFIKQTMLPQHFLAVTRALPAAKERYDLFCRRQVDANVMACFSQLHGGSVSQDATLELEDSLDLE